MTASTSELAVSKTANLGNNILESVERGQQLWTSFKRITALGDEIQEFPMPRIRDEYLDCVLYLYASEADADAGKRTGGSGFWVGCPIAGLRHPPTFVYAVTNKHVIQNGNAVIRLSTREGKKAIFATDESDWTFHPNDDDLAVYSPTEETFDLPHINMNFVRSEHILDVNLMKAANIGVGDDVFIVGRFINHKGKQRNLPTARFGCIGQMPWEPIKQDSGLCKKVFWSKLVPLVVIAGLRVSRHCWSR